MEDFYLTNQGRLVRKFLPEEQKPIYVGVKAQGLKSNILGVYILSGFCPGFILVYTFRNIKHFNVFLSCWLNILYMGVFFRILSKTLRIRIFFCNFAPQNCNKSIV